MIHDANLFNIQKVMGTDKVKVARLGLGGERLPNAGGGLGSTRLSQVTYVSTADDQQLTLSRPPPPIERPNSSQATPDSNTMHQALLDVPMSI